MSGRKSLPAEAEPPRYRSAQIVPSTLMAGEGDVDLPRPLQRKAGDRTENILARAHGILRGERQELEGKGLGERWLWLQLKHMCDKGVLTAPLNAYVMRPEKQKVIGQNPHSHIVSEAAEHIADRLPQEWAAQIHTCGTRIALREDGEINKIHRASRIIYAPPGDLNTLYDMMRVVDEKLKGNLLNKPLIIENSDNYWTNLMTGFKAVYKHYNQEPDKPKYVDFDAFAHHFGIYVTETREKSLELIQKLYPKTQTPLEHAPVKPILAQDAVIFVATGTKKKFTELQNIFLAQGYKVRLLPIDALVNEYVSPDETSGTYEGNTKEKVDAAIHAWERMPASERINRIKFLNKEYKLKLSENNMYVLAEDSGFHFLQPGVGDSPRFIEMRSKMDVDGPFPGVETGPIGSGSLGVKQFMATCRAVFQQNGWTDTRVLSTSVLGLTPLRPSIRGRKMLMTAGVISGRMRWDAMPEDGDYSLDHYFIPDGFGEQTARSYGQEYEKFYSARAKAWMALAREAEVTAHPGRSMPQLAAKTFVAGIVSEGKDAKPDKLIGSIQGKGIGTVGLSPKLNTLDDVQKNLFSKADAFVLAFDPQRAQEDFWRNLYIFTSLIVGEQTRDKHILNKPIKLLNPDGAFDGLVKMVNKFHIMGTVKEYPQDLFHEVKTVEQAVSELEDNRKGYLRYHAPEQKLYEEGFDSPKKFNVAIFCSASNESEAMKGGAAHLTEELCKRNFGIVTGAGGLSMMGAVTDTVDRLRNSGTMSGNPPHHTGATVYHLMHKEATKQGVIQKLSITPNIYERIETMIKASQAFVIMPGGTGTVQELAALAMLKKRAIENANDHYANALMKGKEIVIYNVKSERDGKMCGFYDDFLKLIPPDDFKKLGIHVYSSEEAVLNKIDELNHKASEQTTAHEAAAPRRAGGRR